MNNKIKLEDGLIVKSQSGFYDVESQGRTLRCRARGRFRKVGLTPLVGDRVSFRDLENEQGWIERILPRKNAFVRPSVANVDQIVVIASGASPRTDPCLIDRICAIAALKDCGAVIVLNKSDLNDAAGLYKIYTAAGYPTLRVSAETGEGLDELKSLLVGKLSAFTGNSGVGKSSILNAIDENVHIPVGEVSQALGRGRHTTRHVELFHMSCGADAVDSPGFSSFDSDELDLELKHQLADCFPEFRPHLGQCRFVGCSHTKERDCAILKAIETGDIQISRHESYVRLFGELKELNEWEK
jgi:ribosome biogenesis GTPase